jgi:hypothetical protein
MIEAGKEIGLEYHEDVNHLPPGSGDRARRAPICARH